MALTDREAVRLLIGDADSTDYLFTDDEIDWFLSKNSGDVYLAAADALEALAASAAYIAKLQATGKFTIDRRAIPKALLDAAQKLRDKANDAPALSVSEMAITDFQRNEIVAKSGETVAYK